MKCDVCESAVGNEQKYVCYITKKGQITLCTSCISKGMRKGSGAILTKDEMYSKPVLVFNGRDERAGQIAEDENWNVNIFDFASDEVKWVIEEHWVRAQDHYWFCGDGQWKKDVTMKVYECFRRSCQNIRNYLGVWVATKGGTVRL